MNRMLRKSHFPRPGFFGISSLESHQLSDILKIINQTGRVPTHPHLHQHANNTNIRRGDIMVKPVRLEPIQLYFNSAEILIPSSAKAYSELMTKEFTYVYNSAAYSKYS